MYYESKYKYLIFILEHIVLRLYYVILKFAIVCNLLKLKNCIKSPSFLQHGFLITL